MQNGDPATVFLADDDANTRGAIELVLRSVGLQVESSPSIPVLVESLGPDRAGCVILSVRAVNRNGFDAQRRLRERGCFLPVIVVTASDGVAVAVQAMRAGALDVLARPFSDQTLIDDVHLALARDRAHQRRAREIRELQQRYQALTPREREVMRLVVAGTPNRQIGTALGITERTVKAHRGQVMAGMQAASLADLMRMARDLAEADVPV